jgi:hypothetical protein
LSGTLIPPSAAIPFLHVAQLRKLKNAVQMLVLRIATVVLGLDGLIATLSNLAICNVVKVLSFVPVSVPHLQMVAHPVQLNLKSKHVFFLAVL